MMKSIDFVTSKFITDFTITIKGTQYYLSPKILLGQGYSFSFDYWSICIIINDL